MNAVTPRASVVVCTRNRRELLAACLAALSDQTAGRDEFEVIVVDNGSVDGTSDALGAWTAPDPDRRRAVVEPRAGLSHARNCGLAAARGDVVLYLDDDASAPRGWVAAHLAAYHRDPDVVAAGGPVVLTWPSGRPPWLRAELEHWFSALDLGDERRPWPGPDGPYGTNMSVRRTVALDVGGFSPALGRRGHRLISNEEQDFFGRVRLAGGGIVYDPAALLLHRVLAERTSRRWVLRRGWAQGRSNARLRSQRSAVRGRALVDVIRAETGHAMRDLDRLVDAATRRDEAFVLDDVARRSGHVSGALEQVWLWAREPLRHPWPRWASACVA
jgi:glycosyltransferase involved in cell wall biosynthesis